MECIHRRNCFVNPYAITDGTSRIPFIGGSVLNNQTNPNVLPLGYLIWPGNVDHILVAADILKHPKAKVFFLSDINGLEKVPQPFTKNLMEWLFSP